LTDKKNIKNVLKELNLKNGDADVVKCYLNGQFDAISSDDSKFLRILDALDVPYLTPSSLILYVYRKEKITQKETIEGLIRLKKYISDEEYYLAMNIFEELR